MALADKFTRAPAPRIGRRTLADVAASHTFRLDAKQAEERFALFDKWIEGIDHFLLGDMLPAPVVKGAQPNYVDGLDEGVRVITTMAIQSLAIDERACRIALSVDYGTDSVRRPRADDVLLTVDGGTSIGKAALFDLDGLYAVDSHVAILRPVGIEPGLLVHLLASPLGQLQFQRSESGASGQTAVTEDDIRRFRFPVLSDEAATRALTDVRAARAEAQALRKQAEDREAQGWTEFLSEFPAAD
ncbi:hypothetical protein ACFZA2_06560 [Microbacterium sp. NPDC007973]|uniref:hypothetical protein n=1 Tax=Microbacterium sp. NPDC007973 TaxID=3364182 RepID=UPI0036EAB6C3